MSVCGDGVKLVMSRGTDNQVLQPFSIRTDRGAWETQIERMDSEPMLVQTLRYLAGDSDEMHRVRVSTRQQEVKKVTSMDVPSMIFNLAHPG